MKIQALTERIADRLASVRTAATGWTRNSFPLASKTASEVEVQVLCFPVAVVFLASLAFLFGGTCGAWQWWTAVGLALAYPFRRGLAKSAVCADFAFLFLLAALWLWAPLTYDFMGNTDTPRYHLPMIRLLAEGWNPVYDPSAAAIAGKLGLDLEGMAYVHVEFISKTAAIFNACAYSFVRDPYALTYPFAFFIWLAAIFAAVRMFRSQCLPVAIVALWLVGKKLIPGLYVDNCMMLSCFSLILTMLASLRDGRFHWLPLMTSSFWMANIKLPDAAAVACFWGFFLAVAILRKRGKIRVRLGRLASCGLVIAAMSAVVSFSPYGTSWRDYGHPLYPFQTIDQARFPVQNISGDLKYGNDDAKQMGYWGDFFNAYTLPGLVRKYYGNKLCRKDFAPHRHVYDGSFTPTGKMAPLTLFQRIGLWLVILTLLAFDSTRWIGLLNIACLFLLPREYMGFLRYQPWFAVFNVVATVTALAWLDGKFAWVRRILPVSVVTVLVMAGYGLLKETKAAMIQKSAEHQRLVCKVYACWTLPESYWPDDSMEGKPKYIGCHPHVNNFRLLLKQLGKHGVEVVPMPLNVCDGLKPTIFGYWIPEDAAPLALETGLFPALRVLAKSLAQRF